MPAIPVSRHLAGAGLLAAALASGCATTTAPLAPDAIEEIAPAPEVATPEFVPVVRYGRYTLVELAPMAAQRDLLLQTIDVSMPEDGIVRPVQGEGGDAGIACREPAAQLHQQPARAEQQCGRCVDAAHQLQPRAEGLWYLHPLMRLGTQPIGDVERTQQFLAETPAEPATRQTAHIAQAA